MMKSFSSALALLVALSAADSSLAFAPTRTTNFQSSALRMSDPVSDDVPAMSQSMPFMAQPAVLIGALAGDVGFDPLGFAKTETDLMNYREAEVKHARLAMLAAAGWPLSEVFDRKIAATLGMESPLDGFDRVPR